ncbi:porin, partial [Escherichia coli]|uniref:porin n=1 Tax=Escherichia coli TaxID=562 RepID=UPI00234DE1AC
SVFLGLVEGLNFAEQYQGKNSNSGVTKQNGDGYAFSVYYNIYSFGTVDAYSQSDRINAQASNGYGDNAEVWPLAAKYDANNIYAAMMYGETRNMTVLANDHFANQTQNFEAVVQYQFDLGLRPSLGYVHSKGQDLYARDGHKGF